MTKARVSVAATAIAKVSSGGEEPPTATLWTSIGWASRSISGPAMSRFSPASLANSVTCGERHPQRPVRQRRFDRFEDVGARSRPRMWTAPPSTGRLPPLITRFRYLPPSTAIRLAIARFAWASSAVILSSTSARLQRVRFVDQHFDLRRAGGEGGERVDLVDQVFGQDQRREHVARFDLVDALRHGSGPGRIRLCRRSGRWTLAEGSFCAAEADPRVRRHFVEEGDPRLFRPARDREADQDRDQHRVDDEQHRLQRRAAEDLQVLEQQPAHAQCPRWWR